MTQQLGNNYYNSPYKFNGKELDDETGLYYYGARYYDPRVSIWMSVDPMAEKTMDAYGYCYQNPINLIDPDGRESFDWVKHNALMTWDSNVKNQNDAVRYYGASAKYYASNNYRCVDKNGDYNLFSENGKIVKNGSSFQVPDRAIISTAKKELYKKVETANKVASAISAGSGGKDVIIEGAIAIVNNDKIWNVTEDIISTTSSAGVAKYMKYSKGAGVVLGALGTAYSANEARIQYQAGGLNEVIQHRDGPDATVGAVGLGATALTTLGIISNPVGWGIGIGCLTYGAGCLIYDAVTEEKK